METLLNPLFSRPFFDELLEASLNTQALQRRFSPFPQQEPRWQWGTSTLSHTACVTVFGDACDWLGNFILFYFFKPACGHLSNPARTPQKGGSCPPCLSRAAGPRGTTGLSLGEALPASGLPRKAGESRGTLRWLGGVVSQTWEVTASQLRFAVYSSGVGFGPICTPRAFNAALLPVPPGPPALSCFGPFGLTSFSLT